MRRLTIAILVISASSDLAAQSPDRTLERISVALERSRSVVLTGDNGDALRTTERQIIGVPVFERLDGAPKLGPFQLATPQLRGEFARLALPVGAYVSQGIRAWSGAKRGRQQQAARRQIAADLKAFNSRSQKP